MRFTAPLVLTMLIGSAAAADPAMTAAAALYDGVRIEKLPNGLHVVMKPVPGSGVVTTMVAYKVGACDENLDATGLSHYLEHLMFKGTDKLVPGDVDRLTLRNGGKNNAWTSEDLTMYHFDFAADRWEAALDVEADRMRNLRIDDKHEFRQEKGAVIAELDRNEDQPFDLENKALLPRLFGEKSPYGHPVIGEKAHVRGATAEVIKGHYDQWYHPNNAVLVICGDFDPTATFAKVTAKFGPIPAAKLPERKVATAASRAAPVRYEFASKFEVPRMVMGYNGVPSGHADEPALDVLQSILAGGKTGRLYKTLVEGTEIASTATASNSCGRFPGWFGFDLELLQGKPTAQGEKLVLAEIAKLAAEPVKIDELKRAQRQIVAGVVFSQEGVHPLCEALARAVSMTSLDTLKGYLPAVAAVTPADVQRVAKQYLNPETRVTVWSLPKPGGAGGGKPVEKPARKVADAAGGFDLAKAKRVVLPNGLTLLMLENHRLPIVSVQAFIRGVRMTEPAAQSGIATLTGSLLDEGTTAHSGDAIATLIEDAGGDLRLNAAGGSVKVLSSDLSLGLSLLIECMTKPAFPKEAFARLREQMYSGIDETEAAPDAKAGQVYAAMVYGDHPLGRPALGTKATLAKLTPADCRSFHQSRFVPNRTVMAVVGDFDADKLQAEVTALTAGWKTAEVAVPKLPAVAIPEKATTKILAMPEAAQLYLYMGHAGITRNNPDYFKLLVMDYILGTGPGFTDRLSAKLRDRMGLAYTVSAAIASSAGEEPGTFTCYIGTYPDKLAVVKEGFLEEIRKLRSEPPTAGEVEDVKRYLLGSIPFRFSTSGSVAEQLLQVERFGLGFGYLDRFRKEIAAVTPDDVTAMATKYLAPDRMILVVAGPVDEQGKPLKK